MEAKGKAKQRFPSVVKVFDPWKDQGKESLGISSSTCILWMQDGTSHFLQQILLEIKVLELKD